MRGGGEPFGLGVLAAEGLDDQRAVEGLVGDLADLGAQRLGAGGHGGDAALEGDIGGEQEGEDHEADEGEDRVGDEHGDGRDQEQEDTADDHGQGGQRLPGGFDVGVGVGQQLPGGVAVVPGQGEAEVLAGDLAAVAGLHAELHEPGEQPPGAQSDGLEHADTDEQGGRRRECGGGGAALGEGGEDGGVGDVAENGR